MAEINIPGNLWECVQEMIASARRAGLSRYHGFLTVRINAGWFRERDEDKISVIWDASTPDRVRIEMSSTRNARVAGIDGPIQNELKLTIDG